MLDIYDSLDILMLFNIQYSLLITYTDEVILREKTQIAR